jgi:MFS family permease
VLLKAFNPFNNYIQFNLLMLFTAGLLFWSSLSALLPTLPLYVESLGATKQQIGIVIGCFAIGMLLFRPQCGVLADRQGRKIVLLIGILVAVVAPLGYLATKSLVLLMVVRAFHGISIAAFSTGYTALVADLAPADKRGEIMGYMSLVNPVGVAIGPALGGYLQVAFGYTPLFLLCTALSVMGLLCILPLSNSSVTPNQQLKASNNQFWQLLISPRVRTPAMVFLLFGLVLGTLQTFIPLFIKSIGVDLNPGLFFTAAAISSFGIRLFTGRASDQYGRGLFITLSLIGYVLATLCVWRASNANTFLLAALFEGAASSTAIQMMTVMMADRALPSERGQIFGVTFIGFDLGWSMAGPILGSVAEQFGYGNMFCFAALLGFVATLIFLTQSGKGLVSSFNFAIGRAQDSYAVKYVDPQVVRQCDP